MRFAPPHLLLSGASAGVLLAVADGTARLGGQSCGYFDGPEADAGDAGVAPDGSSAYLRLGPPHARTAVLFEHCRFTSCAGTADDPCVLGRLTILHGKAGGAPGQIARLNLSLFLASPRPCVLPFTEILLPLGWGSGLDADGALRPAQATAQPVSLGGHLLRVPTSRVSPWPTPVERERRRGLLPLTFGPPDAGRPLHAVLALRVCPPALAERVTSSAA